MSTVTVRTVPEITVAARSIQVAARANSTVAAALHALWCAGRLGAVPAAAPMTEVELRAAAAVEDDAAAASARQDTEAAHRAAAQAYRWVLGEAELPTS